MSAVNSDWFNLPSVLPLMEVSLYEKIGNNLCKGCRLYSLICSES